MNLSTNRFSTYAGHSRRERAQAWGYFVAGIYNLLRLARLEMASAD